MSHYSKSYVTTYSQEQEDLFLDRIFRNKRIGFYVDIGAFDPFKYSNTALLYKKGWTGINIDASAESIKSFKIQRKRDINITVGVCLEEGVLDFYNFGDKSPVNTFDPKSVERVKSLSWGSDVKYVSQVQVRPLADILEEYMPKDTQIDIMDVDIEGFDLQALQSNNWEKFKPTVILVEICKEESIYNVVNDPVTLFLKDKGYAPIIKTQKTCIYMHEKELNKEGWKL